MTSSRTLHTSGCFSAKVLKARLIRLMQHFHRDYVCLMSPNKDETRSQSVTRIAVDGCVFSLVLMYDGEIISALLMITNTIIQRNHMLAKKSNFLQRVWSTKIYLTPSGWKPYVLYKKKEIIFEVVRNSSHYGTEISTIKVKSGKRKYVLIKNIYFPSNRTL